MDFPPLAPAQEAILQHHRFQDQYTIKLAWKNSRTYRIVTTSSELSGKGVLERYRGNSFTENLLDKHRSQIYTFFKDKQTIASYLSVWTFLHTFVDSQDILYEPRELPRDSYSGIRYRGRLAVPRYDPSKIQISEFIGKEGSNFVLQADVEGETVLCFVPILEEKWPLSQAHELDFLVSANQELGLPLLKFKGALVFPSPDRRTESWIVGYILQNGRSRLSEASDIPGLLRAQIRDKLDRSFKRFRDANRPWGGSGPRHIHLDEAMEPRFRVVFDWVNHTTLEEKHARDSQAMEKVVSFLEEFSEFQPRRSVRIDERRILDDRIPVARPRRGKDCFTLIPIELKEMIFEHILQVPNGKAFWMYDHFAFTTVGEHLERWNSSGLTEVLPEARSFFYALNEFIVDISGLESFFAEVGRYPLLVHPDTKLLASKEKCYQYLTCITLRVGAERDYEGIPGWREGLQKLSTRCPQLKNVHVDLYGDNGRLGHWWERNEVLRELRRTCQRYITVVRLTKDTERLKEYTQPREAGMVDETSVKIFRWFHG